jgi:enoyl-CoA hydratase/carnithine racemase
MSDQAALQVTVADGIGRIAMQRPQVLNALNRAQRLGLAAAFDRLDGDAAVRAIILSGEGRAFCAGQDQRESAAMDARAADARIDHYAALYDRMRRLAKPVIAQCHGHVAGAGLQLALLCDLRIAAAGTRFGMTESNIGSAAIMGSWLLAPVIGEALMKRLVLLSDFIPAETALGWNLVHEVVPEQALAGRCTALAADLAQKPANGIRLTKAWWREMTEDGFRKCCAAAHAAHAENFAAGGFSAGSAAFVSGKRAAPGT